jgi:hypothetical protein
MPHPDPMDWIPLKRLMAPPMIARIAMIVTPVGR